MYLKLAVLSMLFGGFAMLWQLAKLNARVLKLEKHEGNDESK